MPAKSVTRRAVMIGVPGIVAIVLALTAAFGGFQTVKRPPPKRYAPGQVIDQTLFHTRILRAYIGQATTQKPGIPALHVELLVVNESDRTMYRDPLITTGGSGSPELYKEWQKSPSMLVYADGRSRQFISAEVRRPFADNLTDLPPHIPAVVDTEWLMYRFGEKPGNIQVSVGGYWENKQPFYDLPAYWLAVLPPDVPSTDVTAKPLMIATVHLPLTPSSFKPHNPDAKKPKPTKHPKKNKKPRHRKRKPH